MLAKKEGAIASAIAPSIASRILTTQQGQNLLRFLIGDLQHCRAGLHQDLGTREGGTFLGKISVADGALGIRQVGDCVLQGRNVGFQRGVLEGSKSTAERSDFVDGRVGNQRSGIGICTQCGIRTGTQLVQATVHSTQRCGIHARNADAGLLVADNIWAKLEQGSASTDGEGNIRGAAVVHREREVEHRRVDGDCIPLAVGGVSVHRGGDIATIAPCCGEATSESSAGPFIDDVDIHESGTSVGRRAEVDRAGSGNGLNPCGIGQQINGTHDLA